MATGAIVFSWGTPIAGRESEALALLQQSIAYGQRLVDEGRTSGQRIYTVTTGNQATMKGVQLIEGEIETLQEIWFEKEYKHLVVAAEAVVQSFTINLAVGGEPRALAGPLGVYTEVLSELGFLSQ